MANTLASPTHNAETLPNGGEWFPPAALTSDCSTVPSVREKGGWADDQPEPTFSGWTVPDREALYADFQPLVRRLIRQYGEDPELRQDLAGEIYCRFCDLVAAFDPSRGIPLRAYLVRSLTASVYTYSRSQWRRQHREVSLEVTAESDPRQTTADPSRGWDDQLMTREVLNVLPAAISELPLRQRQVVIWRYYEARSFEEIAEALHVRPATARSLLRHGLNGLRRRIASTPLAQE
jgi:RNA polymerase sigma-70 factor, ECF subfamily